MEIYGLFELARTAVLVLVVVLAALFLWRAFKGGKHSVLFHILAALTLVICLVVPVVLNGVLGVFGSILNSVMVGGETPEAGDTLDRCRELAFRIAEEGMVLLENKDDALPLEKGEKVNLIGYTSYNPVYSGTGSGFVANDDSIDIVHSLESAGFVLNPELVKSELFAHIASAGEGQSMGFIEPDFSNHEAAASAYTGAVAFDQLAAYSDTAIITFGRRGSENADLAPEYQDLSDNEKSVLEAARANFSKVIVLVNSGNAMDMQWVRDYDVDAVIWTGLPGPYGFEALGRILSGEVNPSGSLPDTWVYDRTSNPVSENFGEQEAANAAGRYYVDYVEGIYVGYKWYETAFAEGAVITNTKNGKTFDFTDYENIVAYPFGYGLSYTSFEEKIVGGSLKDTLSPDGSYTVEVAVTNTGVVAGKRAVQLYVTVPYTDYDREHKVEKAAVSLVTYAKTGLLKPGETETVTLSFELESIASYDSSADNGDGTKGAYMLDAGEYVFSVRSDAHTVLDSVTTSLAETHFYSGDAKRKSDESAVKNQFEDAARGEYLSRDNAFANYASAMASVKNTIEDLTMVENNNVYDKALDEGIAPMVKGKDYAASGTLTLQDLKGASYDDPRWSALISQMTVEELADFAKETMYNTNAIDSIGKPFTVDADGPLGLSSMFKSNLVSVAFPCIPLLAGSFNTELAYGMGADVAELAALNGITGWYAPAMDTHRFALSGRNFEYYSEDATLGA
ncbi:MAG: glycoside hydrolase family 3 protein, partial [Lachnospiraceae bacterium]|nr:glycoside hydrolase family 3 protein [Lachnospiraceae bacterium]